MAWMGFFKIMIITIIMHFNIVPCWKKENTIASFEEAISAGADGVSLDIMMTMDKHVFIELFIYIYI